MAAPPSAAAPSHTMVIEHVAPATRLLEKRRQMREVQDALEATKRELALKEEGFKRREETIKNKDLDLQESLVRFSKFLQENDSKRTRAERKAADEIKIRLQKEVEIEELTRALADLKTRSEDAAERLARNVRYKEYLESVINASPEYEEIPEILLRHETLAATNADLLAEDKRLTARVESEKADLTAYSKRKQNESLGLNNEIARLKIELERASLRAADAARDRDVALAVVGQKTLDHGQVCMAADNIFIRCRRRSAVKYRAHTDPLEQLHVVWEFVSDMSEVVKLKDKR